jgi:hypothetical protein
MTELIHRMIICGEELEMQAVMAIVVLIMLIGNDRVLLGIMYQVQENGEDFLRLDGMQ